MALQASDVAPEALRTTAPRPLSPHLTGLSRAWVSLGALIVPRCCSKTTGGGNPFASTLFSLQTPGSSMHSSLAGPTCHTAEVFSETLSSGR